MCPVGANGCRYADKYKRLEVLHRALRVDFRRAWLGRHCHAAATGKTDGKAVIAVTGRRRLVLFTLRRRT